MATVAVGRPARGAGATRAPDRGSGGLIGVVGLLVVWEIVGLTCSRKNGLVPPPTAILSQMRDDGFVVLLAQRHARRCTRRSSATCGATCSRSGSRSSFLVAAVPRAADHAARRRVVLPARSSRSGRSSRSSFNGQTPKIILAALSVFFTTLVGMLVGLRSADKTALDVDPRVRRRPRQAS